MRILLFFLGFAFQTFAQNTCEVAATVEDATGGRIPGSVVTWRGSDNRTQRQSANQQGEVKFLVTPCVNGRVDATFPGFDPSAADVKGAGRVKLVLGARSVIEQVQVSAATEMLQTARATQSVALTSQQLQALPTASRNVTHLLVAESGVSANLPDRTGKGMNLATAPGAQADDPSQSLNPSVNGARPTNNSLSLNGLDATNMMNSGGGLGNNIQIPLDSLEVVEMQTALYSAMTGRNGGGNIQMITRGGSNQFHGSAYHFFQNEKFNANEFFLNRAGTRRPRFRRNETGVTFGGPIRKDKTFFFASVQRVDFVSGYAARAIAATGVPTGLTDTRTRESIAAVANEWLQSGARGNATFTRNFLNAIRAFPADQVPGLERKFFADTTTPTFRLLTAPDIHPVAINALNVKRDGRLLLPSASDAWPLLSGNASYGNERLLQQSFPTVAKNVSGTGSLDHYFHTSSRLRLNYTKSEATLEEAFGWANSSPSPTNGFTPSWSGSLNWTRTYGGKLVSEFRGGFFELYNTRIAKFRDIRNSTLGIYNPLEEAIGGLASLMPTIDINTQRSTSGIGNAWDFFDRQRVINAAETMSYTTGKHTIHFGGEFRRPELKGEYMARTNGDLDYDNWVFFFTGHGASGGGSDLDQGDTRRHFRMRDLSLFVQDDWRVRRGLTLNAGLRWDYYGNPTDVNGAMGNYYTPEAARALGLKAGFYVDERSVFFQPDFNPLKVGISVEPGVPWNLNQVYKAPWRSTIKPDYNNFAPRLGLAWQLNPKLVVRTGYGIFYERVSGAVKTDLQLSAPFFIYQNVPAPVDMADPYPRLNLNPFQIPHSVTIVRNAAGTPSWRRFDGSAFPATSPFSAKNNTFVDPFLVAPYVQQWTLNVQYEVTRGSLLDIRYVGSKGTGLLARLNLAQPEDPRVKPVNGFNDIVNSAGAAISPDFFVRPEFLGLNRQGGFRQRSNWGKSSYHSLQANLRRRMGKWVTGNFSYTWAKSIDTVSSDGAVVEHNAFNIAANRAASDFDRRHRFTAAYVIELPTPEFALGSAFGKAVLGGWNISGLATLQTGTPFSLIGNATRNASFAQPSRVRLSMVPGKTYADAVKSGRTQDRLTTYFDPSPFTDSLDQWGNTGRNILRGPNQVQYDFMFGKQMRFSERIQGEFRWEMYNAFNRPVFTNPASTFAANGPGTSGVISSTIGGPRTMQTAVRIRF
jgi:hypothetical protein